MEKDQHKQDLENFIRRQLEGVEPAPDADTWANIAARQRAANRILKWKFYGIRAAGVLVVVAIVVWGVWHFNSTTLQNELPQKESLQQNVVQTTDSPDSGISTQQTLPVPAGDATAAQGNLDNRPAWYRNNPIKGQTRRFLAETGILYQNPVSGNKVRIPGGALVYADGRPVTGEVDLFFREYRTMADFVAAGMPMHYGDGRGNFFFNSGGMFEVRVSQNGEDLKMAPNKNYTLVFAPTHALRNATLYYLPDATNQWKTLANETESASKEPRTFNTGGFNTGGHGQQALEDTAGISTLFRPRVLSAEEVAKDNLGAGGEANCLPGGNLWSLPDSVDPVVWLQESIVTGRAYAFGEIQPPVWFTRNSDKDDLFFLRGLERSEIKIVHRYDTEARFFPDDLGGVFTELAAFKGYYFTRQIDSTDLLWRPDRQAGVDEIFRQQRKWKRVSVFQQRGAECTVVFGDENEEIRVPAKLSRGSERASNTPFNPSLVFADYEKLRTARQQKFTDAVRRWRHFVKLADVHQTPEEWCLPTRMWFDFFDENKKMMRARYDSLYKTGITTDRALAAATLDKWRNKVRQLQMERMKSASKNMTRSAQLPMTLTVSGFGTYNWDQIFQIANPTKYLYPRYKTLAGESIVPVSTRIIDRDRRLYFSLPDNRELIKVAGRSMDVIVTDPKGRIYYLPGKTYAGLDLKNAEEFTFQMEDVTDKVGDPEAWGQLLGI